MNYSPDPNGARWPRYEAVKPSAAVPFDSLIDGWAKEVQPAQSTVDQWRVYFRDLEETTGITDASRLTTEHVIQWKDALLDRGGAVKTINDSKLAAVSRVLTWAVENRKLPVNVAMLTGVFATGQPWKRMGGSPTRLAKHSAPCRSHSWRNPSAWRSPWRRRQRREAP